MEEIEVSSTLESEEDSFDLEPEEESLVGPVDVARLVSFNANDLCASFKGDGKPPVHLERVRWKTESGEWLEQEFRIRELGGAETTEVLTGQFRKAPDGSKELDVLSSMDRMNSMTLYKCVVDEKGEPFFSVGKIQFLYTDKAASPRARGMLDVLYSKCIYHNPQLDLKNPNTLQTLVSG